MSYGALATIALVVHLLVLASGVGLWRRTTATPRVHADGDRAR
jgi:hypothetical protein